MKFSSVNVIFLNTYLPFQKRKLQRSGTFWDPILRGSSNKGNAPVSKGVSPFYARHMASRWKIVCIRGFMDEIVLTVHPDLNLRK